MTTQYHQDCCSECGHTFFWQPGLCCDNRSELLKQFAEENKAQLSGLFDSWYVADKGSEEKTAATQGMKDLYHDFLTRQAELVSEGFLLEEMAKVTESFALLQKEPVSVGVSVGVAVQLTRMST